MKTVGMSGKNVWAGLVLALGAATVLFGCRAAPRKDIQLGPQRAKPAEKELNALVRSLSADSASIRTLRADLDVAIVSPLLQPPQQLNLSGRIVVKKTVGRGPAAPAVAIDVKHDRGRRITFTGDGEYYEVDMPILDLSYSGRYRDILSPRENRLHFTPVEIANAFNLEGLLERPSTLRAYPSQWDHAAIGKSDPVEFPPRWAIDSLEIDDGDEPRLWVHNSVVLDRRTERPLKIDTFRPDGSLMARTWIMDERVVRTRTNDRRAISVPSELMIWYPPPLEGTVIRLRISRATLNEEIDDSVFEF